MTDPTNLRFGLPPTPSPSLPGAAVASAVAQVDPQQLEKEIREKIQQEAEAKAKAEKEKRDEERKKKAEDKSKLTIMDIVTSDTAKAEATKWVTSSTLEISKLRSLSAELTGISMCSAVCSEMNRVADDILITQDEISSLLQKSGPPDVDVFRAVISRGTNEVGTARVWGQNIVQGS